MPPSKIECFINDTKKVFHLQMKAYLFIKEMIPGTLCTYKVTLTSYYTKRLSLYIDFFIDRDLQFYLFVKLCNEGRVCVRERDENQILSPDPLNIQENYLQV